MSSKDKKNIIIFISGNNRCECGCKSDRSAINRVLAMDWTKFNLEKKEKVKSNPIV